VLDALRFVAALAVALYHYTSFWAVDGSHTPAYYLPTVSRVTVYGFLGVELFFMISGFVIGMSSWGRTLGGYLASRLARLYPAYWACVAITLTLTLVFPVKGGWIPVYDSFTAADVAINLTMLQEPLGHPSVDNVYWTLWAELRFYLLWALVVGRGVTYRKAMVFCGLWMVAAVLATQINNPVLNDLTMRHYAGYFCAGILLYLLRRFGPSPLLAAMLAVTAALNLHSLGERVKLNPGWVVPLWPAVLIIAVAYLLLIAIALGRLDRLDWRWLTLAGALTYPYYLLHQRLGYIVLRHGLVDAGLPLHLLVPATMLLMLVPAWLVHRHVERRFGPRLRTALQRGFDQLEPRVGLLDAGSPHIAQKQLLVTRGEVRERLVRDPA
jgi:peptidoglycan/LPS O-acetylase OafA/YrhL